MESLTGRTAIVTGAGQGVGKGIAQCLANDGAKVVVAELNEENGQATANSIDGAIFVKTDILSRESIIDTVTKTLEQTGSVDILVNNAYPTTGGVPDYIENKSDSDLDSAIRGGIYATWWAMQAVFPSMRDKGWGRIVNLCSLNGVNAFLYTSDYNIAKEGVRTLTRSAAREWAKHGIMVNAVCPAAATPSYEMMKEISPESFEKMLQQNPQERMGDPLKDIGPVVSFLSSEGARYLTGNTLYVDGGSHINGVSWRPMVASELREKGLIP